MERAGVSRGPVSTPFSWVSRGCTHFRGLQGGPGTELRWPDRVRPLRGGLHAPGADLSAHLHLQIPTPFMSQTCPVSPGGHPGSLTVRSLSCPHKGLAS